MIKSLVTSKEVAAPSLIKSSNPVYLLLILPNDWKHINLTYILFSHVNNRDNINYFLISANTNAASPYDITKGFVTAYLVICILHLVYVHDCYK